MEFIIFKAAFHFHVHMLFQVLKSGLFVPMAFFNMQTVPNNIIAFFSFINASLLFIEITAIIVCPNPSNNPFAVKCILDAADVLNHAFCS